MAKSITSGQKKQIVQVVADAAKAVIEELGFDREEGQFVLKQGNSLLKGAIREALRMLSKTVWYPLTIDRGKSVEEMICLGQYHWWNRNITTKNFPQSGTGVVTINVVLVHPDNSVSVEGVLAHLEANGLRPATLAELLAFGATYPEIQRQFSVCAPGSSFVDSSGSCYVPFLSLHHRNGHGISFVWDGTNLSFDCRFLAVPK